MASNAFGPMTSVYRDCVDAAGIERGEIGRLNYLIDKARRSVLNSEEEEF